MAVKISPVARQQFGDANGVPYSGALLFTYATGSTTKQTTYTDSTGNTPNSNPIELDSAGRTPYGLWLTSGLVYKYVFAPKTDTDPPTSPIFTEDGISGVNDTSVISAQWGSSGVTPTYISATQFSVPGDQTVNFHVNRRVKLTLSVGTVYGTITASAYTTTTTVTVSVDSGALDSGLSSVDLSVLTSSNHSVSTLPAGADIASSTTINLSAVAGTSRRVTGTIATSAVTMNRGQIEFVVADAAWPLVYNVTTNKINTGGVDYLCAPGDTIIYYRDLSGVVHGNIVPLSGDSVKKTVYKDIGVFNLNITAKVGGNNAIAIYTASSSGVPIGGDLILVAVPTSTGVAFRTRAGGFLSGTDVISLSDATNYWSKGSLDAEIKTAWLYAIAPAAGGIVWALGGYAGFTRVPTTTTVTDDDYLHLENSSTYTRAATDYCVCVGRARYQYDTSDTPDHTFQDSVLDAPQITYNPRSDYTRSIFLSGDNVSASDIADYSAVSCVIKQSGKYRINSMASAFIAQVAGTASSKIRTGSSTYASATIKASGDCGIPQYNANSGQTTISLTASPYLNAGDTIHLGVSITATTGSGNRTVYGGANNYTGFTFSRCD